VVLEWKTGGRFRTWASTFTGGGRKLVRITQDMVAGSALLVGEKMDLLAGTATAGWTGAGGAPRRGTGWRTSLDGTGRCTAGVGADAGDAGAGSPIGAASEFAAARLGDQSECPKPEAARAPAKRAPKPKSAATVRAGLGAKIPALVLRASSSREERQRTLAASAALKILVKEDGWYRIEQPALVTAGLDPRWTSTACRSTRRGAGALKVWDRRWAGLEPEGPSSSTHGAGHAVHRCAHVLAVEGSSPGGGYGRCEGEGQERGGALFLHVELKERKCYFAALKNGESENFFGSIVSADGVDRPLVLKHLDGRSPGDASLEVVSKGDEHGAPVQVLLNGTEVGEARSRARRREAEISLPQSLLREGENAVHLAAEGARSM